MLIRLAVVCTVQAYVDTVQRSVFLSARNWHGVSYDTLRHCPRIFIPWTQWSILLGFRMKSNIFQLSIVLSITNRFSFWWFCSSFGGKLKEGGSNRQHKQQTIAIGKEWCGFAKILTALSGEKYGRDFGLLRLRNWLFPCNGGNFLCINRPINLRKTFWAKSKN